MKYRLYHDKSPDELVPACSLILFFYLFARCATARLAFCLFLTPGKLTLIFMLLNPSHQLV